MGRVLLMKIGQPSILDTPFEITILMGYGQARDLLRSSHTITFIRSSMTDDTSNDLRLRATEQQMRRALGFGGNSLPLPSRSEDRAGSVAKSLSPSCGVIATRASTNSTPRARLYRNRRRSVNKPSNCSVKRKRPSMNSRPSSAMSKSPATKLFDLPSDRWRRCAMSSKASGRCG